MCAKTADKHRFSRREDAEVQYGPQPQKCSAKSLAPTVVCLFLLPPIGICFLMLKLRDRSTDHSKAERVFLTIGIVLFALGLFVLICVMVQKFDPNGMDFKALEFPSLMIPAGIFFGGIGLVFSQHTAAARRYRLLIWRDRVTDLKELAALLRVSLPRLTGQLEAMIRDKELSGIELSYREGRILLKEDLYYCAACGFAVEPTSSVRLSCPHCRCSLLLPNRIPSYLAAKTGIIPEDGWDINFPGSPVFDESPAGSRFLSVLIVLLLIFTVFSMIIFPVRLLPQCLCLFIAAVILQFFRKPVNKDMMLFCGAVMSGSGILFIGFIQGLVFFDDPLTAGTDNYFLLLLILLLYFALFAAAHFFLEQRSRDYLICRHLTGCEKVSDPETICRLTGLPLPRIRKALKNLSPKKKRGQI